MFDAIIVGAGPSGSRVAELLSAAGLKVLILEKKQSVGKNACSGLISVRLKDIVPIENDIILNLIAGAEFHYGKESLRLKKDRIAAFVVDRVKLDQHLLQRAKIAGAAVRPGEPFDTYTLRKDSVVVNGKYRAKVLVGADGASSRVRSASNLPGNLVFMNGAITYFEEKSSAAYVDVYYDNKYSPDFFAWKIPRGNSVEYGVASKNNHLELLKKFLASQGRHLGKFYAHPMVSGIQETAGERLILVGDAAAQVKPFSGGGVIYGLLSAQIAAEAIISANRQNDFSKAFFMKNYDRKWKAKLMGRIELGAQLLHSIKSLTDKEKGILFGIIAGHAGDVEAFADMDFL